MSLTESPDSALKALLDRMVAARQRELVAPSLIPGIERGILTGNQDRRGVRGRVRPAYDERFTARQLEQRHGRTTGQRHPIGEGPGGIAPCGVRRKFLLM